MTNKSLTKRLVSLALIASMLSSPLALAKDKPSAYKQQSIEAYIQDYYKHLKVDETPALPGPAQPKPAPNALDEADKNEYATDVLDQIILLPTLQYNDVFNHIMADYRQHPDHREAIERVVRAMGVEHSMDKGADVMRAAYRDELKYNPTQSFVETVIAFGLTAMAITYSVQFGRGILKGFESESTGLKKFRTILKMGRYAVTRGKTVRWVSLAPGASAGLVVATLQSLETRKNDPRKLLHIIQGDTVRDNAETAARMRDEIRGMTAEKPEQLKGHSDAYRKRITEMDLEVTRIQREMEHLYDVAAEYRGDMEPVAQDLTEVRTKVSQLGMKLDRLEITGAMPL